MRAAQAYIDRHIDELLLRCYISPVLPLTIGLELGLLPSIVFRLESKLPRVPASVCRPNKLRSTAPSSHTAMTSMEIGPPGCNTHCITSLSRGTGSVRCECFGMRRTSRHQLSSGKTC